uniref:Uncharacterized protein n=1 Tax=Anguilla anguilla TaxID=7936 RepID=A0A0E9XBZ2_ANGAN
MKTTLMTDQSYTSKTKGREREYL